MPTDASVKAMQREEQMAREQRVLGILIALLLAAGGLFVFGTPSLPSFGGDGGSGAPAEIHIKLDVPYKAGAAVPAAFSSSYGTFCPQLLVAFCPRHVLSAAGGGAGDASRGVLLWGRSKHKLRYESVNEDGLTFGYVHHDLQTSLQLLNDTANGVRLASAMHFAGGTTHQQLDLRLTGAEKGKDSKPRVFYLAVTDARASSASEGGEGGEGAGLTAILEDGRSVLLSADGAEVSIAHCGARQTTHDLR